MAKEWVGRFIQATLLTVTLAAVCQELEKPEEERHWHGRVGFIPYDFRPPTIQKIKDTFWNPESTSVFMLEICGVGWAVNFHALLEKMRVIREAYYSEDDFLMPTQSLKKILENRPLPE